jgi:hypothetical protein
MRTTMGSRNPGVANLLPKESAMSYLLKASRALPVLIILLLDDSASMGDALPGTSDAKYLWVERYVGIILKELLSRSTEVQGQTVKVKPRYFVGVIHYGGRPRVWEGGIMDIQTAVEKYTNAGNSLGLGGKLGGTDAKAASEAALDMVRQAIAEERFKNSFPPMVFHLTDGESQSDPSTAADQIKQLATADGNALMVNAYIGTQTSLAYTDPKDFPGYLDVAEAGPSQDNVTLFNMSSLIPDCIHQNLVNDGIFPQLRAGTRLFFDVRTKEMLKHVIQVVGSLGSRAAR